MRNFDFYSPTYFVFGKDREAETGRYVKRFGGSRVLVVYGGQSAKRSGLLDRIMACLKEENLYAVELGGVKPNPRSGLVYEGIDLCRREKIDFILAVGGGSVIDCCKVISAQALLDEDIWEMEYGKGQFPNAGIPVGAVVTASGTGAEMNAGGVITHEEKKWKGGIFGIAPVFAVLDPAYTMSVPPMQVLSGAFDTLSHAMETYFGNSDQDNVSDDVALAVMRNTVVNMRRLLKNINDRQARSNLMWDSAMAENGILKCGRLTDSQTHQIEHQLGAYTDCDHGQGLAVIHPVYYRHIVKDAPEKFARLAKDVFGQDTAEAGVAALESFIKECGLPTKLSRLKSTVEITPEVLRQVADTCNIIKAGPRELSRDEIYEILMECL